MSSTVVENLDDALFCSHDVLYVHLQFGSIGGSENIVLIPVPCRRHCFHLSKSVEPLVNVSLIIFSVVVVFPMDFLLKK